MSADSDFPMEIPEGELDFLSIGETLIDFISLEITEFAQGG